MRNQNSKAQGLILLMLNLCKLGTKEEIIEVFIEALKSIWTNIIVLYQQTKPGNEENIIEVSSSGSNYGYINIDKLIDFENEDQGLLHYAAAMLAVILKKNE